MIIVAELNTLVDILHKAGMDYDDANDIVIKATGIAQDKKKSVIKIVREISDPGAHVDFIERQLAMALLAVSTVELDKLESLNKKPE